jgi:DNA-binding beta-propeller fold protein YncE
MRSFYRAACLFFILTNTIPVASGQLQKKYNLTSPDRIITLPIVLHEISGITAIDTATVAAVQDENGVVFILDIINNKIIRQITFFGNGDYEDIARSASTLWVLRSDGAIFEISAYTSRNFKVSILNTGVPSEDNEGLFFNRSNNRLLIGCKSGIDRDNFKNKRAVFAFDTKTKRLSNDPVYTFDIKSLEAFSEKNKIKVPRNDDNEPDISLRISALALHPLNGKLYVLSASDRLLFVFNNDGSTDNIINLDKKLFRQPEGITFLPDGAMLISNEGADGDATILMFRYR